MIPFRSKRKNRCRRGISGTHFPKTTAAKRAVTPKIVAIRTA